MEHENFSSSEDEGEYNFKFWNNWDPLSGHSNVTRKFINNGVLIKNKCFKKDKAHISAFTRSSKFGNWIPPNDLFSYSKKLFLQKSNEVYRKADEPIFNSISESMEGSTVYLKKKLNLSCDTFVHEVKEVTVNSDWGKRIQLHDVTNFKDGDFIWGIVDPGLFAVIKLWVNEYNNICGLAEGTISKIGSSEATVIKITNTQLLRKMLGLSCSQWESLCELVQQKKATLKFEALKDYELKTSLEKLWFFICKRRHFLCEQSMLVQLSGALKCVKEFKIIPKLVVQDIRDA